MNLESQIVIFSCNQRTVKKLSCQFQEEKIYGKMQKTVTGQKETLPSKHQRQTGIIKTPFFGCCFLTGKICSLFTMQSIRVIIKTRKIWRL